MAFILKDRVKETTTTTGTGAVSLGGASDTFDTFQSYMTNGDTTYYAIVTTETGVDEWEVGLGTWNTGNTLTRTTILSGSNGASAVDFSAGEKEVFMTYPASKAQFESSSGDMSISNDLAVSGDIDVAGSIEVETHMDLKTTTSNKPSHAEGRIFYDAAFGALAVYNDESDITLQVGQEEYIRVKNDTASTITNGTPVYLTGEDASTPTIAAAKADGTYAESQAVGVATHDIEANSVGYITVRGLIADVDTSHLTVGEKVHVAVGGGTTTTAPSYPYFATDVGICLISSASGGCIYVYVETHAFETLRVTDNAHFDGNVTVDGDLTVLGDQTIAASSNISIGNAWNYFNAGDTIGSDNTTHTGSGLDDGVLVGHFNGTASKTFYVKIDATGTPDTFSWSDDNFATTEATGVAITGAEQTLADGVKIEFNATTGHTLGDIWSGTAAPSNVDTGIASNRNTGGSGVGYTHIGLYYDVSTNKWTFFDEYDPEPEGTIDVTDSSFSYGTVKAGTFEGDVTGDVTGAVTGNVTGNVTGSLTGDVYANNGTSKILENGTNGTDATFTGDVTGNADTATALETARTISLTGDVTGSASFDGSANASITAVVQDNSHAHTIANVTGLQTALDDKADDTITITAGNGLTGGGDLTANRTLNVGAGTGVTVGADDISIGQDVSTTSNVTFNDIRADGGNLILGDDAYSSGSNYVGMKTSHMSGADDYMIISGTSDGDTFVSAKSGNDVYIRGGGNTSTYEIKVQPDAYATSAGSTIITEAGGGLSKSSRTLSHADTSTQASVNNSGRTYIQDITLDTYGHVTGITSATETVTDTTYTAGSGLSLSGTEFSVSSAPQWTTARTLSLSGDASGSVSWDGSANATLSVTVANDSHTHKTNQIYDARNDGDVTPDGLPDKSVYYTFTDDITGSGNTWDSVINVAGWGAGYTVWQLMSSSDADDGNPNLYFRRGRGSTWGSLQKIWTDNNDGSGSGLDADTLDGVQGSAYMRSDTSDSISGDLTINGQNALICNGTDSGNPSAAADNLRVSGYGILGNRGTMYITNGGGGIQFGVGSTHNASSACTIDTSKNFTASGNVTAYSDERLKDNIVTIDNALDKIAAIRGVTYNRNDIEGAPRQSGVIAQEVEKVLPEVVLTDDEGIKTVAYGNMVGLLIEAIKEQQAQIDELKEKLGM